MTPQERAGAKVDTAALEEARRDVRARAEALGDAELALENTRWCSALVHREFSPMCEHCAAGRAANLAVSDAELALEASRRRLEAVESQVRDPQWIGGER